MHFPVIFFVAFSLCSIATANLLRGRQIASENSTADNLIAQCAPNPFTVHQFTTFSGSDTSPPQISFFFTNQNGVDVNEGAGSDTIFCSVTLTKNGNVMSDDAVWPCQNGTAFRFDTESVLTISQSMICDALWEGAPVWVFANGSINTTSQSGVDGGVYNTSVETDLYLEVFDIEESIPSSVPNLPTCGQMCFSAELSLGPSLGCSASDDKCLCESDLFTTAFRDCLVGACDSVDETQESTDYFNGYCDAEGVPPPNPSPLMQSGADCGAGSDCT